MVYTENAVYSESEMVDLNIAIDEESIWLSGGQEFRAELDKRNKETNGEIIDTMNTPRTN